MITLPRNKFLIITGITIFLLCLDVIIIKLPVYSISNRTSDLILGIFSTITLISIVIQLLYLSITFEKSKIDFAFFKLKGTTLRIISTIIQSVIIGMLLIVLFQIIISVSYFTSFIKYIILLSTTLSIFFTSLLLIRFLFWLRTSKSKILLFFTLSALGIIVNSIVVILFSYFVFQNMFQLMDPLIPSINNMVIHQPVLKNTYVLTSSIEFTLIWVSSVLILKPFSSKIGEIKFWLLISIPNIYFISKFHFYHFWLSNLLIGTDILGPVSYLRFISVLEVITSVVAAIVFGVAFWIVSRKISDNSLKQSMQISGIGVCLLFLSSQVTTLTLLPYPPFGLVSISFASISSYLLFIGLYHAAMITSRNSVIRSIILKSTNDELRFIGSIGTSEMKHNITSQFKQIVRKYGAEIKAESHNLNESENEIKGFVSMALQEREKYLRSVIARGLYKREDSPFGKSWEKWVELWWQWCYSFPERNSPVTDLTGQYSSKAQTIDSVWFLAGTFGGKAERTCTIPKDKAIFFPILNNIISYHTDPQLKTSSDLDAYAKLDLDHTNSISAMIDGQEIPNLNSFRVHSQLFAINVPNNDNKELYVSTEAISDGYWLFLKPLSLGKHKLQFKGEKLEFDKIKDYQNFSDDDIKRLPIFNVEVTYSLEVI